MTDNMTDDEAMDEGEKKYASGMWDNKLLCTKANVYIPVEHNGDKFLVVGVYAEKPKRFVRLTILDDDEDGRHIVNSYRIRRHTGASNEYVQASINRKHKDNNTLIHRYIMRKEIKAMEAEYPGQKFQIDHRNGCGRDNRRCNLRVTDNSINGKNKKPIRNSITGVPGITITKSGGTYHIQSYVCGYDRVYSKSCAIKRYGPHEAFRMALEYRTTLGAQYDYEIKDRWYRVNIDKWVENHKHIWENDEF